jgi:hypothetical protein
MPQPLPLTKLSYHFIVIFHMALRSSTRERVSLKDVTTFETMLFLLWLACISGRHTIILRCVYFGFFFILIIPCIVNQFQKIPTR